MLKLLSLKLEIVYDSLSQGRLYGKDIKALKDSSKTSLPEGIINPIHGLLNQK